MAPGKVILAVGLIVNSALYLAAVFIAALLAHNLWAEYLAIAAMGVTYLSYAAQVQELPAELQGASVMASMILGLMAGLALFL